jgi:hypothetical protein
MKPAEHLLWLTSQIAATMARESQPHHSAGEARKVMAALLGVEHLGFRVTTHPTTGAITEVIAEAKRL